MEIAQNLPGLSVAVGAGGEIVWAEGFGWPDLERRVPVAPGMRFRIGGASMPLTSAAVGLLLEKERLHLDAEIQTYVAAFPEKQWPVTLRQLMGHLGGTRKDGGDEESLFSQRCEQTTDAFKRFAETPLQFEPGTRYHYSTLGWILVSAAVEAAAKEPFFTFMRAQIFKPLGMADTTPDAAPETIPDRATFYFPKFAADNRYGHDVVREGNYACLAGAAAFLSTPSDLVRFTASSTLTVPLSSRSGSPFRRYENPWYASAVVARSSVRARSASSSCRTMSMSFVARARLRRRNSSAMPPLTMKRG